MNNEYLLHIDQLIDDGKAVLETKIVHSTPYKAVTGHNAVGEEYIQKRIPATKSEFVDNAKYIAWTTDIIAYLQNHFKNSGATYINNIQAQVEKKYFTNYTHSKVIAEILAAFRVKVASGVIQPDSLLQRNNSSSHLNIIINRFHNVVRQLRLHRKNREIISVSDEYDVQYLLHALLQLFFDDIRQEEWTPSFAGASARMDFLLKNEQTVVEVKMARESMTDKNLGDELIEDVARYKNHPDCKKLICFVYDPLGLLGNPNGIMNDLNSQNEGFVDVIIRPL